MSVRARTKRATLPSCETSQSSVCSRDRPGRYFRQFAAAVPEVERIRRGILYDATFLPKKRKRCNRTKKPRSYRGVLTTLRSKNAGRLVLSAAVVLTNGIFAILGPSSGRTTFAIGSQHGSTDPSGLWESVWLWSACCRSACCRWNRGRVELRIC